MNKEQESKYPWHEAPEWAMWAATDEDGEANWIELEPIKSDRAWINFMGYISGIGYFPELAKDWQNSLEKRPEKCTNCENSLAKPLHLCPYKQEVEGDNESLCNCCINCELACNPFST